MKWTKAEFVGCVLGIFLFYPQTSFATTSQPALLKLSLSECIKIAKADNSEIQNALLGWEAAQHQLKSANGIFEPHFSASYRQIDSNQLNSALERAQRGQATYFEQSTEYKTGITGVVFNGGTYDFGLTLKDGENTFTNEKDEHYAFLGLTIQQPLLKNGWFGRPLKDIYLSRADESIGFHQYRSALASILYKIETTYWELVVAQEKVAIANQSVGIAKEVAKDQNVRLLSGNGSKLEVASAEAGVSIREINLADQEQERADVERRLRVLLNIKNPTQIIATEKIIVQPTQNESVSTKNKKLKFTLVHPGRLLQLKEIEKKEVELDVRKNELLPDLTLQGSYGRQGLSIDKKEALRQVRQSRFNSWDIRLNLNVPLLAGISEQENIKKETKTLQGAKNNLEQTELEISTRIEMLSKLMTYHRNRVLNSKKIHSYYGAALENELKKLHEGSSSVIDVYTIEQDRYKSRYDDLESQLTYQRTVLSMEFFDGSFLSNRGVETITDDEIIMSETLRRKINED